MINIDIGYIHELDKLPRNEKVYKAALYYASMGELVVPQIGKAPQVKEADASGDPATIHRWFGPGGAYEGKNIGLVLQKCRALDLDRHGDKDGVKYINTPLDQIACPREATPGNGYHLIISNMNLKGKPDHGVDIRSRITTYPSEVDGVEYRWEVGGEPGKLNGSISLRLGGGVISSGGPGDAFSSKFDPLAPSSYINFHLEYIDPDCDYDTWLRIGMAIHANDTGDDSLGIWTNWSQRGSKFKDGECESKWATFSLDRLRPISLRWLIAEAKKNGCPPHEHDAIYYQSPGPTIRDLNEKYGLYNNKGKPYVVSTNERGEACFSSPGDLETILANRPVIINGKPVSAAKVWLASHERREVYDIGMWMPGDEPTNSLNTWTGLAISAVKCEDEEIQEWLDFCVQDICRGNRKYAEYLWDLLAKKIQQPLTLMGIALVISGGEGTGKGLLTGTIGSIIGPNHAKSVSSRDSLVGTFAGDVIANAIYVEAHEASWSGNHTESNRLKALMSETRLDWNGKFKPQWSQPNSMLIAITTNEAWAAPAGIDSRRFFVLKTSDKRPMDMEYWKKMAGLIGVNRATKRPNNPEYLGKIRHWLENRKIKSDLNRAMETEWLTQQRKETAIDSRDDLLLSWVRITFCVESAFGFNRPGGTPIPKVTVLEDDGQYVRTNNIATDYRDFVNKNARNRRAAYDDGTLYEMLDALGLKKKKVRKHRVMEMGKLLENSFSDTKISVLFVPPPDEIETNITKKFPLFAEGDTDEEDDGHS